MKKVFGKMIATVLAFVITVSAFALNIHAAPTTDEPIASFMPMWYYMFGGKTSPEIHETWTSYYYSSRTGAMRTTAMPGALYISQNGMNTYCSKETFNLQQFLLDNPDLVACGITDRDRVWEWICTYDAVSPRYIHSTVLAEEYYCIIRDWCIYLGVYNWAGNPYSIAQRVQIIDDYICRTYAYDYSFQVYDFQTMMGCGTGVCNAYAGLFDVMASMSGINSGLMIGPNHIWNVIQTEDGQWWEVDSTWNDGGLKSNGQYLLKKRHGGGMNGMEMSWWITEDLY